MIEQIRKTVVENFGGTFKSADEHVHLNIKRNGDMACSYDAMPGTAIPSSRDRFFRLPAGRVKKKTRMALQGHGWLFEPYLLREMGLIK